ncbi:hypothetical protein [Streptomyces sp. NPDC007074]|uniref:hypothetical protein n=1 Tax=Streptomyces sp. NPDC007074 TaxID=3156764 RepID=UPI0033D492AB
MSAHQTGPYQQPAHAHTDDQRIDRIAQAFSHALDQATEIPTRYKDASPVPAIGTALPVPQPGRPPMSQKAVDLNTTILTSSVLTAALGGSASAILWASGQANPTVIGWICGCVIAVPAALTIPVLAIKSLMKAAKDVAEAAPPVHHHHYSGDVYQDQRTTNTETRGIVAITRNELPPTR